MSKQSTSHSPALPWILFIGLAIIWGSSFILMKRGLQSFSYTQVGTLRVSIAALFMAVIGFRHFKHFRKKDLISLTIVGFLGNAIPYVLFPLAVNHLDSGVVGIINSLVPLFTVLIGGWFFGQKATDTQWQGVAVGLLGAVILIFPMNSILQGGFSIEGELGYGLFGVLATMMYGTSVNTLKSNLPHLKALTVTTLSLATAAPFTIIFSLASGVHEVFLNDPQAWTNFGFIAILGVIGSGHCRNHVQLPHSNHQRPFLQLSDLCHSGRSRALGTMGRRADHLESPPRLRGHYHWDISGEQEKIIIKKPTPRLRRGVG